MHPQRGQASTAGVDGEGVGGEVVAHDWMLVLSAHLLKKCRRIWHFLP